LAFSTAILATAPGFCRPPLAARA